MSTRKYPHLRAIPANFEQLLKAGDCTKRQSFQLTIWEDREFEFIQQADATLLSRISVRDGNVTRVMEETTLGFGFQISLYSNNDKLKLNLRYPNAFVDELTPNTQTSDVKMCTATANLPVEPRKRVAVRVDNADDKSFLLFTLLPSRTQTSRRN